MLIWHRAQTDGTLHGLLETLAEEYPLAEHGNGAEVSFQKVPDPEALKVERSGSGWIVRYGSPAAAARGLGYALAGREAEEKLAFKTFGILLDCSRTGIVTVEHFKHWLRRLALFGYNMAMLYTKDAYQLPGETYFGYMRGAYSQEEIREIDAYAKKLGIEMVASIQALGHLEPILRWPAYGKIKDTDNVLMVDEPESYKLLEKMLRFWSEALGTRRIHLGMDETHDLGRGRFMDRNGYERGFDLYNRHLKRLCEICGKFELKPMIWSDMYFRLGNPNQDYYDPATVIPDDVKAAIAPEAELCYWDYYHRDQKFYEDWIQRHRDLDKEPVMASGIWTWSRMWYDHEQTVNTAGPCIDACRKTGLKEIIFTMWGDDGGYCEFDSAFAGMAWAADYAYNGQGCEERTGALFQAVMDTSYQLQLAAGELEMSVFKEDGSPHYDIVAGWTLWDDPLMGILWHEMRHYGKNVWDDAITKLKEVRGKLEPHRGDRKAGHIDHAWNICNTLIHKLEVRRGLVRAYREKDTAALTRLRDEEIPAVIAAIGELMESFRVQWFRSYKSWGLEVMQIKLSGLCERYREVARRLEDPGARIEELELEPETLGAPDTRYRMIATGGWFI